MRQAHPRAWRVLRAARRLPTSSRVFAMRVTRGRTQSVSLVEQASLRMCQAQQPDQRNVNRAGRASTPVPPP
jgi:hypothetical protein